MANASDRVSLKERRFGGLSLLSLAAATVGFVSILIPGANASHRTAVAELAPVYLGLRMITFLLLAVLLGILGRRSRMGRFALIGSGTLLAVLLTVTLFLFSQHKVSRRPTINNPVVHIIVSKRNHADLKLKSVLMVLANLVDIHWI